MGQEAGEGGLNLILSVGDGGGVKVNFCLVRRGVRLNFEPYFAHFPTPPPPLQIIIAQSLSFGYMKALFLPKTGTLNETNVKNRQFSLWRHFTTTTIIPFFFPFLFKFCNPHGPKITMAPISIRKQKN